MDTKPIEKIKVKGAVGEEPEFGDEPDVVKNPLDIKLKELRKEYFGFNAGLSDKEIRKQLVDNKIIKFDKKNCIDIFEFNEKKVTKDIRKFVGFDQVAVIKEKKVHVNNKKIEGKNIYLETATDNSGLYDLPYQIGPHGITYYMINGIIVSGWSMYYGPSSIRSPEDYAKNIDMIFNVPYLFAALDLRANMGLGSDFEVIDEDEENSKMAKYGNWLLKRKLKINNNFRKKVSFHKKAYGNSYIHIHRDKDGSPDRLTILQPERMKTFLDRMTQKILFYVYLPPIIGAVQAVPYYGITSRNEQHAIMQAPALRYPSPVVIPVNDIIHWKVHDYTEYPFGFSDIRSGISVAQARFDVNLLAPYYFKKYCKPMLHAQFLGDVSPGARKQKKEDMKTTLENLEPGSDLITTGKPDQHWEVTMLNPATGQSELFNLTNDLDAQIFAITKVPETYFKPKGTTDRMISENDKELMTELTQEQEEFAEIIFDRILKPAFDIRFGEKKRKSSEKRIETSTVTQEDVEQDPTFQTPEVIEDWEREQKYPRMTFNEITKKDETQEITNVLSKLDRGLIDEDTAAKKLGEKPPSENKKIQEMRTKMQKLDAQAIEGGLDLGRSKRPGEAQDKPISPEGKNKPAVNATTKRSDGAETIKKKEPEKTESAGKKENDDTKDNFLQLAGKKIRIKKSDLKDFLQINGKKLKVRKKVS